MGKSIKNDGDTNVPSDKCRRKIQLIERAQLASIASQAVNVWAIVIKSLGVHAWEMPLERYNTFSLVCSPPCSCRSKGPSFPRFFSNGA